MNKENLDASDDFNQSGECARRFCEFQNKWLLLQPRRVVTKLLQGQRVLDVCCGSGDLDSQLVSVGCQVVGVDSSPRMVHLARRKRLAAEFHLMDATTMPFNHEFDAVIISLALHALSASTREKVWASMRRAVHPSGRLVVLDYSVPQRSSLLSRMAHALIEQDERNFLHSNPEHYWNFQEFMRSGGLRAWVLRQRELVERQCDYWRGTLELGILESSALE